MGSSPAGRANAAPELPSELVAALGPGWPAIVEAARPERAIPAWATVELDWAEGALTRPDATAPEPSSWLPDGAALGAHCRQVAIDGGGQVLLLEPSTEGRLVAFLVRYGEGWAAVYLLADSAAPARLRCAGVRLSAPQRGPFGPERLGLGGPRWGPFVVIASPDGASNAETAR